MEQQTTGSHDERYNALPSVMDIALRPIEPATARRKLTIEDLIAMKEEFDKIGVLNIWEDRSMAESRYKMYFLPEIKIPAK